MNTSVQILGFVESFIKYDFSEKRLLVEALTHKSFCILENKLASHNERLEFLGDAILGLVMAENLMRVYPEDNEGLLSKKRASLINQDTLARKAQKMKLGDFLILGPGEKSQGSHLKPRLLASAFEAIIGAIYLDSNFSAIKEWITQEFKTDLLEFKPDLEFEKDYKTRLQETVFKLKMGPPAYEHLSVIGPSHDPEFLVSLKIDGREVSRSQGKSKKIAEQKAAQIFLESLVIKNQSKEKNEKPNE